MDPVQNPYAPGAGRRPPELAGRAAELRRFALVCDRLEAGRLDRGIVLTGLRGVGKTVLLNELRAQGEARHWIVAKVEAGGGRPFRALIAQALNQSLRSATGRHRMSAGLRRALSVFKAFTLSVAPDGSLALGITGEPAHGEADTGDLEMDLTELVCSLGSTAGELGIGVLVLVDEMQDLPRTELAAVAAAAHEAGQREVPFLIVGAGLPSLPAELAAAKSYAERLFEYRTIAPLADGDARDALVLPSRALGVDWTPPAADAVLAAAMGYPYFLQVYGEATWNYAASSPVTAADARLGLDVGRQELAVGFYGSRWERATPTQREYLRAVAGAAPLPASTGDVARALGRRPSDVSAQRDQLIKKGLLFAPDRGTIDFTVPGMVEFIERRPE